MKVKILDDIVKENVLKNIEGIPWFYHEYTYKTQLNSFLEKDIGFFTHYFFNLDNGKSEFFDFFEILFNSINTLVKSEFYTEDLLVSRIKINHYEPNFFNFFDKRRSPYHVDDSRPHIVALFFPCDCDGNFILKNYGEIKPKRNRLVLFEGEYPHAFRFPTFKRRYTINFNYLKVIK